MTKGQIKLRFGRVKLVVSGYEYTSPFRQLNDAVSLTAST